MSTRGGKTTCATVNNWDRNVNTTAHIRLPINTMRFHVVLLFFLVTLATALARIGGDRFYTAAVYEHKLLGEADGGLKANIKYYERATRLAREQGADIIVFPEYGLVPPNSNRTLMREKLEVVPDPKQTTSNPCVESDSFRNRPILTALSCMARENSIVVVANMGALESCPEEGSCPEDGVLQHNTNVAFDSNGTLLARYYKEHLYYELSMDLPRVEQDPLFETEFGTFAMFICFDIVYRKMADTGRLPGVDAVIFSTMWFNSLPFFTSTQWFQAWAAGNDATILAANIQVPGHALSGSGIFRGRHGPAVLTQNPDGEAKLLVATLPRRGVKNFPMRTQRTAVLENGTAEVREDGEDVPVECHHERIGWTENLYSEFRCFAEDVSNYTLTRLEGREGHASVCHKGMCCELLYSADNMNETFYLGVSNLTGRSFGRYLTAEENCFLARCDDEDGKVCAHFPTHSTTLFRQVSLTANFTTDYVYPSLVGSSLRLVPAQRWNITSPTRGISGIRLTEGEGVPLLMATLKGRPYQRDPPFIR